MSNPLPTETRINGRLAPPRTARIVGLGHKLPDRVVSNGPIAERIGVDSEWIVRRTGIRERRYAAPDERTSDLATAAARRALQDAGLKTTDIDLVLVATMTPDELTPNTAPLVAHALGIGAGAYDVGSACTGWLAALSAGAAQIETGRADAVLVIGAEILSRVTDPADKRTAAIFGDGAGAVVLSAGRRGRRSAPSCSPPTAAMGDTIVASHEERFIHMDGHTTFNKAVKVLADSTLRGVRARRRDARRHRPLRLPPGQRPHPALRRARSSSCRRSASPTTSARRATRRPPRSRSTLSLLREDGRLRPGQRLLLSAVGAGFTWGAGVVEWGLR